MHELLTLGGIQYMKRSSRNMNECIFVKIFSLLQLVIEITIYLYHINRYKIGLFNYIRIIGIQKNEKSKKKHSYLNVVSLRQNKTGFHRNKILAGYFSQLYVAFTVY